jgi:hypothetical protein
LGLTAASAAVYDAVAEKDGISSLDRPALDQVIAWRTPLANRIFTGFTRGCANPCRRRIRLIVRADGTTIPGTGTRSSCIRIRFDPHRGCFRRISATTTSTAAGT